MKNRRLLIIILTAAGLLSVPLIAMQFSQEVDWDFSDFAVMGALLFGAGLSIELVLRKVPGVKQRLMISGVILLAFLLVWAELAVGLFGTPFAGS